VFVAGSCDAASIFKFGTSAAEAETAATRSVAIELLTLQRGRRLDRRRSQPRTYRHQGPRQNRPGSFDVPVGGGERPSHRLYELLAANEGAHSRYNALVTRIVSFARAAEHASSR
jgi:hypothetical protein